MNDRLNDRSTKSLDHYLDDFQITIEVYVYKLRSIIWTIEWTTFM